MASYVLSAPLYRLNGQEHRLSICKADASIFSDARFEVREEIIPLTGQLTRVRRTWRNISGSTLVFQPILDAKTTFAASLPTPLFGERMPAKHGQKSFVIS